MRTAVEAQRRRGDDDTTTNTRRRPRGDNDRAPISATEMLPPNRADAGTRRRGDDEAATTTASLPLQPPLEFSRPIFDDCVWAHSRCSPHTHSRCSAQAVTEASGAATAPASLLPQAFRCPQSLQPPSLTGLAAPLTQEDGWWRRGRRRDDDDATTSTGGRDGAERTEGDAQPRRRTTACSPCGALLSGLAGRRGGDAARRGAVGRHRRPGRCFLLLGDFRQLPAVQDAFGGAPVLRMLESQLLPIWPAVSSTSSLRTSEATRKSFHFWSGCGWARRSRWSCGMQCRGRRSSRGVGPDTCLVISHAHRIAINEQEKGSGAGRRCAGAGTNPEHPILLN